MSVDYEKIGKAIGEAQKSTLYQTREEVESAKVDILKEIDSTAESLDGAITALVKSLDSRLDDETEKLSESVDAGQKAAFERLDATDDLIAKSIGFVQAEVDLIPDAIETKAQEVREFAAELVEESAGIITAKHVLEVEALTEQLKSQEVFEGMLEARLADIKDGEKGAQGEQGEAGLDRPLLEPVELKSDKDYPKNTLGTFNGGLWISTKQSLGNPEDDPLAWSCILDAMTEMSIDLQEDRSFKMSVRFGTGKMVESEFNIPFPEHKGIWEEGSYSKGEIVTKGHSFWQAMEDTTGEPPGNGWKQILSAPRGKTGADGKSIVGPQGKPGRNGVDAKLPANFVEDLVAIASERKAFEDGRSAAEAITSFRGYFTPDESYSSGDVVNHDGGLYICVSSGRFDSIAKSQSSWELMLGTQKYITPAFMYYRGDWVQKTYQGGDVVVDGDWTMVALTKTADRAAPYPEGEPFYLYDGTLTPFENAAKSIVFGNRYYFSQGGYLNGYRVDTVIGNEYSIYAVSNPTTNPVISPVLSFTAEANGWRDFGISSIILREGSFFDLFAVVNEPAATPVTFVGNWNYTTPNNQGVPGAGVIIQSNAVQSSIRVNYQDDDGADRFAELDNLTVGDTITGATTWTIISVNDLGTYFDFGVTPGQQAGADGVREFTFETLVATPISIGREVNYWNTNPNIQGILSLTGDYASASAALDENAYGIDILLQEAYVSPNWGKVAYGGTSGGVSALSTKQVDWVQRSAVPYTDGSTVTTDNTWTELGRLTIDDLSGFDVLADIDGKRTDAFGFASGGYNALVTRDGTIEIQDQILYNHLPTGMDFRYVADGADVVAEVRGLVGQTWEWSITSFNKELT